MSLPTPAPDLSCSAACRGFVRALLVGRARVGGRSGGPSAGRRYLADGQQRLSRPQVGAERVAVLADAVVGSEEVVGLGGQRVQPALDLEDLTGGQTGRGRWSRSGSPR